MPSSYEVKNSSDGFRILVSRRDFEGVGRAEYTQIISVSPSEAKQLGEDLITMSNISNKNILKAQKEKLDRLLHERNKLDVEINSLKNIIDGDGVNGE